MLLATSAVHHHLIRKAMRTQIGIVLETGEAREVHLMFNNCYANYGTTNAREIADLLADELSD